ncbi:hypothetical protein D3C85_1372740 [compost metagenome]
MIAAIKARSEAVSSTLTPPTTLRNTSWSWVGIPPWRCSTASNIARRFGSRPRVTRRGLDRWLSSTSACTSTSIGRVPSHVAMTTLPGTSSWARLRNIAEGLETSLSPRSVMPNTPSSLTAPKRFLTARSSRRRPSDSPSKYNTVSTMCSSTRGPASEPSLVTWPTRKIAVPLCLA